MKLLLVLSSILILAGIALVVAPPRATLLLQSAIAVVCITLPLFAVVAARIVYGRFVGWW